MIQKMHCLRDRTKFIWHTVLHPDRVFRNRCVRATTTKEGEMRQDWSLDNKRDRRCQDWRRDNEGGADASGLAMR
jgi:hypothetical protein